jgi:TP901 family phage tail tape measure protein
VDANVVEIVVRTRDVTAPGLASARRKAAAEAKAAAREQEAAAAKSAAAQEKAAARGKTALLGFAAVAAGVAVVSTEMAATWQQQMVRLATSAGETGSVVNQKLTGNLKLVSEGLLQMAGATGTSTDELARGMYMVESAGFHGAAGLKVMQAAAEGAKAEGAPLQEMANALTSAMKSYHIEASGAVGVTDMMVAAVGHGKMKMADFASAISTVLPIAASAGVSFAEIGGAMATLTNHGTSAHEATQELAFTIRNLVAPNKVARKELAGLGIDANELSMKLGTRGLSGTLDVVRAAISKKVGRDGLVHMMVAGKPVTETFDAALKRVLGGANGLNTALMLGGESLKDYKSNIKAVGEAAGKAGAHVEGWDKIQGTFKQQQAQFVESLKALAITIGTELLPAMSAVLGKLTEWGHWLAEHPAQVKALAIIIGTVLVAAVYAYTAAMVMAAAANIAATWEFLVIALAIGALIVAFSKAWEASETFRNIMKGALTAIVGGILWFVGTSLEAFDRAFGWIPGLGPKLHDASKAFNSFAEGVKAAIDSIPTDVAISVHFDVNQNSLARARGAAKAARLDSAYGYAHGGTISARASGGPSTGPTVVGEHGPELVNLAPGSHVTSNPDTQRILNPMHLVVRATAVKAAAAASKATNGNVPGHPNQHWVAPHMTKPVHHRNGTITPGHQVAGHWVHNKGTPVLGRAGTGGHGGTTKVEIDIHSSGARVDDMLLEILRHAIRVRGGNVQVVLGSGSKK